MDDEGREWRDPDAKITPALFRQWQVARRGDSPAQDMTNPVWEWLFRGRIDPFRANEFFRSRTVRRVRQFDMPTQPRWAGCRMGQSYTKHSDGREIWIAGEHEDYYDPDFYIYNDVIVRHPDDRIQILGYPESVFRATDFHSATLTQDENAIILVGSIGYPQHRSEPSTQVYCVDAQSYEITEIGATGDQPSWLSGHEATLSSDGQSVVVRGGNVLINERFIENIDDWSLHLKRSEWSRLTDRQWPRLQFSRQDGQSLHLWQYDSIRFKTQYPEFNLDDSYDLAEEIGTAPRMDVYETLFQPSIPHVFVQRPPEDHEGGDWRTIELLIAEVRIRLISDISEITMVVEGNLPDYVIQSLSNELREKLTIVENAPCVVNRFY